MDFELLFYPHETFVCERGRVYLNQMHLYFCSPGVRSFNIGRVVSDHGPLLSLKADWFYIKEQRKNKAVLIATSFYSHFKTTKICDFFSYLNTFSTEYGSQHSRN